jgi:predicted transcriptional regulator
VVAQRAMRYVTAMIEREPSAFILDAEAERRADEEGLRAYETGRVVSHQAVREWLLSWGTADERPRPKAGE